MFQNDSNAMHVQPSLPEVGIHGKDGLPIGSKLGLRGVFGSTVLQGQNLEKQEIVVQHRWKSQTNKNLYYKSKMQCQHSTVWEFYCVIMRLICSTISSSFAYYSNFSLLF